MPDRNISQPEGVGEKPSKDKKERLKLLGRMRDNPRDWHIEDVKTLCRQLGMTCSPPSGGSHYTVSSPYALGALTVPYKRPIKAYYINRLVSLADTHLNGVRAAKQEMDASAAKGKEERDRG